MARQVRNLDAPRNLNDFRASSSLITLATILAPDESEAPILAPSVRQAMFQWMRELDAAKELKAMKAVKGEKANKTSRTWL